MNEKDQELTGLELEDILKEFSSPEDSLSDAEETASHTLQQMLDGDEPEEEPVVEAPPVQEVEDAPAPSKDTVRLDDLAQVTEDAPPKEVCATTETIRLDDLSTAEATSEPAEEAEAPAEEVEASAEEAFEPEPVEEEPPAPIVFDPRARLRDLKRKLIAGPEKRYYELAEIGIGKLQMAMFLCLVVIAVSAGTAVMYSLDLVPENRMRLMVFGQVLAMLLGALLGSYQILDGLADLFRANSALTHCSPSPSSPAARTASSACRSSVSPSAPPLRWKCSCPCGVLITAVPQKWA